MLKRKTKNLLGSVEGYAGKLICGLMVIIMGFLFVESVMHTMELQNTQETYEGIVYHNDNFILNILLLIGIVFVLVKIIPFLEKIPIGIQMGVLAGVTLVVGIFWVVSAQNRPMHDSYLVTNAGWQAANGSYEFMNDRYFSNNPHQLGYVFFTEILVRLFGKNQEKLLYLGIINVVFLTAAYMGLILILRRTFSSKRIQTIAVVTLLFCAQPVVFSVFLYGIIPGITFAIYAILCETLYFQSQSKGKKILWAVLSVLAISASVLIKPNNYIVLVAMVLLAFVKLFRSKNWKHLLMHLAYAVAAVVVAMNANGMVCKMYENRSDIALQDDPIPMISYAVMGMNYPNNVLGCTAAGWYSGYNSGNHSDYGFDAEKSGAASKEDLKERLSYFAHHFRETNDFFYEKNLSQWNEPTYASIWLNVLGKYEDPGKIPQYFCNDGARGFTGYMNVYQMFIFLGTLCGAVICFKKKDIFCAALLLIVLGGFFYHMIFEGKSQYILPYFLLLCGFSAVGVDWLIGQGTEFLQKQKKKRKE